MKLNILGVLIAFGIMAFLYFSIQHFPEINHFIEEYGFVRY